LRDCGRERAGSAIAKKAERHRRDAKQKPQ